MALVPQELLAAYRRPKEIESNLEEGITNLLDKSELPIDQRAKLLSQLIMRYQKTVREPPPPIPVSIAEQSIAKEEEELPMKPVDFDNDDDIMQDIKFTVPHNYEKYVPAIVEKLKTRLYYWNKLGEMTEDGVPFRGSKIVDLFSYVMRNSKKLEKPSHLNNFLRAIRQVNIPHSWIANKRALAYLKDPFSFSDEFDASKTEGAIYESTPYRRRSRSAGERVLEREIEPPWKMRSQTHDQWIEY